MKAIATLLAALAISLPSAAQSLTCEATKGFHDGDTFVCTSAGQDVKVRVAGLDAPETGQAWWRVSRDALRQLMPAGSQVLCYKTDRYQRKVCRLRTPGGQDAALELVKAGLAWNTVDFVHEQTASERLTYAKAQDEARQARRGLWADAAPQPPWECRSAKQARTACR